MAKAALATSDLDRDDDDRATAANTMASLGEKTARHGTFREGGRTIYLPPTPTPDDGTFVFAPSAY
jgi:hypothetical protein